MSWLLAPFVNHMLRRGPNLISEYESLGMPHAYLFRIADIVGATALAACIYIRKKTINKNYGKHMSRFLYGICGLLVLDVLIPVKCIVQHAICTPQLNVATYAHGAESYLLGTAVFVLAIYVAYHYRQLLWLPFAMAACTAAGFLLHNRLDGLLFSLQAAYTLLQLYLLWFISCSSAFDRPIATTTKQSIRRIMTLVVSLTAVLTLLTTVLHLNRHIPASGLLFTVNTAWISQHTFLASLLLLILARAIAQGSINAWRVITCLSFFEVINYASLSPDAEPMIIFLVTFVALLVSRRSFDRQHSVHRFVERLKSVLAVIVVTAAAVALFSGLFKWYYTRHWTASAFTPSRVIVRTLLIEVHESPNDTLKARIFGQVLTSTGIFLYSWIFFGLFLPSLLPSNISNKKADADSLSELLDLHSTSSEDYLKLWPPDKTYWFNAHRNAVVAYKQSGSFALALADPIAKKSHLVGAIKDFSNYCRQHGTAACWVMVSQSSLKLYLRAGLRHIPIGASAVVDLTTYSQTTVKNKWWRWIRNKAAKQNLTYTICTPPHSQATLQQLREVSDMWLQSGHHKERTFALGYHDNDYLNHCKVHAVVSGTGDIIAFANEVPSYADVTQITIDLMRFLPNYDGVMAYLLSEILLSCASNGYKSFDLGFVPLAHIGKQRSTKAIVVLSKKVLKPVFSMQGLEQFKNKFDPVWQQNYIAWDGGVIDIALITSALQKALTNTKQ